MRRPRHRYSHVDVFGVVDGRITAMRSNSLKRYRTDGNRVMAEPAVAYGLSVAAYRHSAAGRAGLGIRKSLGVDRCDRLNRYRLFTRVCHDMSLVEGEPAEYAVHGDFPESSHGGGAR